VPAPQGALPQSNLKDFEATGDARSDDATIDPALLDCCGAEQKQPRIPFDFAQGRLSTSLRFAEENSMDEQEFSAGTPGLKTA
jgi:hypothetical protein